MSRGTPCFGRRHTKTHTLCRRCGRMSYHKQKGTCSGCGYPAARLRKCRVVITQMDGHWRRRTGRALAQAEPDTWKLSLGFIRITSKEGSDLWSWLFNLSTIIKSMTAYWVLFIESNCTAICILCCEWNVSIICSELLSISELMTIWVSNS